MKINSKANLKGQRKDNKLSNGFKHKLIPTKPLNLSAANTIENLLKQMSLTSFGARSLGESADILYQMAKDKDCFIVLTLSGAMTVAKMGLVICDMIEHNMADAIVSTGAIIAHAFVEATGNVHFKINPELNDLELYHYGYDRIYDTLELEKSLNDVEILIEKVLKKIPRAKVLSSVYLNEILGKYLAENYKDKRNVLKSAYIKKVPVYIPAFTDSELGLDVGLFNRKAASKKESTFLFDSYIDLDHFTNLIEQQKKIGIFTVGGGVPRNWAQQVCPYLDILKKRLDKKVSFKRYLYGVRICPEPPHWGGLSGCTYQEGISWGKFTPVSEGGRWAEVYADATIAWPIIVKAVLERLEKDE